MGWSHNDWLAVQDFMRLPEVRAWGRSGFPAGTLTLLRPHPAMLPAVPTKGGLPPGSGRNIWMLRLLQA